MQTFGEMHSIYDIPYEIFNRNEKIAIYGIGKIGSFYVDQLRVNSDVQIKAMIDGKASIYYFNGIPVISPKEIEELDVSKIILATEQKVVADEMNTTLFNHGISNDRILWFGNVVNPTAGEYKKFEKRNTRAIHIKSKKIFIFLVPEHGNLGDYLIGYAEQQFFDIYFSEYKIITVTASEWVNAKEKIIQMINNHDLIAVNGGGYFGDLWGDEKVYKDIICSFPNNKKIFMPNTLTYNMKNETWKKQFEVDIKWLNDQKNTRLLFRDDKSYQYVKTYSDKVAYFPDMALFYKFRNTMLIEEKNDSCDKILLCLRNDIEKTLHDNLLEKQLEEEQIVYIKKDINLYRYISQQNGVAELESFAKLMRGCRLVLTDRLHAMILAVICNVPCIAFDNSTHKVSEVYNWIKNQKGVMVLDSCQIEDIKKYIRLVVQEKKEYGCFQRMVKEFEKLASYIAEFIDGEDEG